MPTKQETFDTVVAHLRKQGAKATLPPSDDHDDCEELECAYRSIDGKRCAVGCLIPDERYQPKYEGMSADHSDVTEILLELGHDVRLCSDLQSVHDSYDVDEWEENFRLKANMHALTYTPPVP